MALNFLCRNNLFNSLKKALRKDSFLKLSFILAFLITTYGKMLYAQGPFYRVDDPEGRTCFFIDTLGNKLKVGVHNKLEIAQQFSNGLICVNFSKPNDETPHWGCLNSNGDTIIKGEYLTPFMFYNGVAKVNIEEMPQKVALDADESDFYCQYINTKGELINLMIFEGIGSYDMDHPWTVTKSGGKWHVLSINGKLKTLSVDYKWVGPFSNGLAKCKRMNTYTTYIDTSSWPVFDITNENYYGEFKNGYCEFSNVKDKYGFISTKGNPVTACIYDEVTFFRENLAAVKMYEKWGFIDKKGKMLVKPEYDQVGPFNNGLAKACINGKWGFINVEGKVIIPLKFTDAKNFDMYGVACVSDDKNLWGFINTKGEWVIKPQFVEPTIFDTFGFATVFYTDKNSYKKGKLENYEKALISIRKKVVWFSGEKLVVK